MTLPTTQDYTARSATDLQIKEIHARNKGLPRPRSTDRRKKTVGLASLYLDELDALFRRIMAAETEAATLRTRLAAVEKELARFAMPIDMQDVRLAVGEGPLTHADVLAGVNAELCRRMRTSPTSRRK